MQTFICEKCKTLHTVIAESEFKNSSEQKIILCVTNYFKIPFEELKTKSRRRENVYARQFIMYFLSTATRVSLKNIGAMFNRDHTTVLYAREAIKDLISIDENVQKDFEALKKYIHN